MDKSFSQKNMKKPHSGMSHLRQCIMLAVLMLASFSLQADTSPSLPKLPKPDYKIIDALNYADVKTARMAWKSGEGTEAVNIIKTSSRNILQLPILFNNNSIPRTIWDLSLNADFSHAGLIKLKLFSFKTAAVENLVIYFQSGKGWYRFHINPEKIKQWTSITLDPRFSEIEGTPSGWRSIKKMRISAWRTDKLKANMYIADLGYTPRDPDTVLILRADSLALSNKGQVNKSFQQYATSMAEYLDHLQIPNKVIGDIDWAENELQNVQLLILPNNPSVPEKTLKKILEFIRNDGKIISFYSIPSELASQLGIKKGNWLRHDFISFKIDPEILPGAPNTIKQHSWNIYNAKPVKNRGKIAAYWYDKNGKTDKPALIITDNSIYMTHVLLEDDSVNAVKMIGAALNYLLPASAGKRAKACLKTIGQIGNFTSYDQAVKEIKKNSAGRRKVLTELQKASKMRDQAEKAFHKKNYKTVYDAVENANLALCKAFFATRQSEDGEFRGFWSHSPYGISDLSWDNAIKLLANNGFTAIFPNMSWGGTAYYNSKVLPVSPEVAKKGDQIKLCLAACKKYGIECHIWKVSWNTGGKASEHFMQKMRREKRLQVGRDGKETLWLCPSNPANQQLEIDAMLEVATKYKVDGIHFDYIRYPGNDYCFCDGCRKRFEKFASREIRNWPQDVMKNTDLHEKWLQFRRNAITTVVSKVRKGLDKTDSNTKISAAVFRNWKRDRNTVAQDWGAWCRNGLLDFVCPMDYTDNRWKFETLVRRQQHVSGKIPIYPGIGVSCWKSHDSFRVVDMIEITRKLKTGGFMIFQYDNKTAEELVPLCGKGLTRNSDNK